MSDILEEMALDNLEMIRQDPGALPWHLKVTNGGIQIQDQVVAPSYTYAWPAIAQTVSANGLGQRQWQLGWTVVPTVGKKQLLKLQALYRQRAFAKDFDSNFVEGSTPPDSTPFGSYHGVYVWARPGHTQALTDLVTGALDAAPITAAERPLVTVGPR